MLTEWFTFSPIGEERRFDHGDGCLRVGEGADKRGRLYVTRSKTGWYWYCHNCGQKGFRSYTTNDLVRGINEGLLIEQPRKSKQGTNNDYYWNDSLSSAATEWLYRYDISDDEIELFSIRSNDTQVMLPIRNYHGQDMGFQIRNLCSDNPSCPKYITRYKGTDESLPTYTGAWFRRSLEARVLVIVEDILSAIKCSRPLVSDPCISCDALALLSSPKELPRSLLSLPLKYDMIWVWLDADKSRYAINYCNTFRRVMGLRSSPVYTDLDPKEYTTEEIHDRTFNFEATTQKE